MKKQLNCGLENTIKMEWEKLQNNPEYLKRQFGKPDGIILGGLQSTAFKKEIQTAKEKNIALVGWHASEKAGPTKDLF